MVSRAINTAFVERLNLTVQPDKKAYTPGERVKLTLRATNEKDQPAPAVVMVAVVDQSAVAAPDHDSAAFSRPRSQDAPRIRERHRTLTAAAPRS